jgi:hypothetical protein
MVKIPKRKIEVSPDEVAIGNVVWKRQVEQLPLPKGATQTDYALLVRGDEANFALSMQQHLNGLKFDPMVKKSYEMGLPLAGMEFTQLHRDVNLALDGEGLLYDASGNRIKGKRLADVGETVNNAWVYLNAGFEKSKGDKGFLGLDIVRVTGFDGENPILERQPLEECVVGGWADVRGKINSQGLYTEKAKTQGFESGKTFYVHQPVDGSVAGVGANPDGAGLYLNWGRHGADPRLGGILRAEGTAPKITQGE